MADERTWRSLSISRTTQTAEATWQKPEEPDMAGHLNCNTMNADDGQDDGALAG